MGLVVPLGGTTVFLRRSALEALGGWDAHNVTEDADLGMRLCRAGYRTEMIATVTYEEANCRPWPWIKQRSRWLKGFLVTYMVHMRDPARLARELGLWRFLSFQAFFLGTLGQFLLAPVIWSYWLLLLGLSHPMAKTGPAFLVPAAVTLFLAIEILAWVAALIALSRSDRRFLIPFIPTMMLYFPLGTLAAVKAVCEWAIAPYFWDKTQHGVVLS
jgi:cellulose synthase/poly-beta-1,6-N-acetylglucosamine synthase-like glycosyltransferase